MVNSAGNETSGAPALAPRTAAGVVWRARSVLIVVALAALALVGLSRLPLLAGAAGYFWGGAAFIVLLGLIGVTALKLRGFIVELSQQIADLSNGACRPHDGAVLARVEADLELDRLRAEVEALKKQIKSAVPQ